MSNMDFTDNSFNSTLVQLKDILHCYSRAVVDGFNSTLVQLKVNKFLLGFLTGILFQFYLSSIKRTSATQQDTSVLVFQFYLSSIKSR